MTKNNLLASINGNIKTLAASEKVTKATLPILAEELLHYVPESKDIDAVNRTLEVCTPMNRQTAKLFFKAFLPWTYDEKQEQFTTMLKGEKVIKKKNQERIDFLRDNGEFWAWAAKHVEIERKAPDYYKGVERAVKAALKHDVGALEIMQAVMQSGVSIDEVMAAAEQAEDKQANIKANVDLGDQVAH